MKYVVTPRARRLYPAAAQAQLTIDGATPDTYLANARVARDISFLRASTGSAMGGGSSANFGVNVPRIHNGRWFMDAGGTNLIPHGTDLANGAWSRSNISTPTAIDGPAGPNTAWALRETTANADHEIAQAVAGLGSYTQSTHHWLVRPVDRDYVGFGFFNGGTTKQMVARASFLTGSVLSPYPVGTGGSTAVDGDLIPFDDQWWLLWITGTFPGAETGCQPFLYTMNSDSNDSFVGDPAKGVDVAAVWAVPGTGLPVNPLVGTRAPETTVEPVKPGFFLRRRVDGGGEVSELATVAPEDVAAGWTVAPRDGKFWLSEFGAYELDAYDSCDRADTSDGNMGTATDGRVYSLLKNPGSFPMVAATNGRIEDGWFQFTPAAGANGAVYRVQDLGEGETVRSMSAELAWDAGGGSINNTSFALLISNSRDNLTERMPVHIIANRTSAVVQYRTVADGFVTLGEIKPAIGALPEDGAPHTLSFRIRGNKLELTWCGFSIVVEHDIFLDAARYACWELFSVAANGSNTDKVKARQLSALRANVGNPLVYTAASPVNLALPFAGGNPVAGNTYSVSDTEGGWSSNAGALRFAGQQWEFDATPVGGATNPTFATATPADVGKKVSVTVEAANDNGSSFATSPQSAALA